ncbi:hypothetical protein D5018_05775 [Parashewanella curva]|uniref:Nuclear transport factor 2 family protein n=1 Tax=Parashewanella curva TaxID=2338552 RepID=A0A3L8Q0N5_9GAMM|nr:hypothetical protein [Parashewanella curva]RLV60609.1 hypothetical protein D5018_05775 [Parashewanella curva]
MRSILLFISIFVLSHHSLANSQLQINQKMNQNYQAYIEAFSALDSKRLANIYHKDAIYISEHRKDKLVFGNKNIEQIYQKFFNRVKHKNAKVSVGFRIINREITQERVTDIGYLLIRVFPASHTEQGVSEFASKFLIIGDRSSPEVTSWKTEMNTHTKPRHYFGLTPEKLLFFSKTKMLSKE